jgi:2-hydroxychromene-2-carboxylate isomerase
VGKIIVLDEHRRARFGDERRLQVDPPLVVFAFDLASPLTYLAAERAERLFPRLVWCPVLGDAVRIASPSRAAAEGRAVELGLPLVWPDHPEASRAAMRVASRAAEVGRASAFVLAASRLAFAGGYDLDHPDVLAEAAAAAGLGLSESLRAARDVRRDLAMAAHAREFVACGVDRLPALRVGAAIFAGEERVAEAAAEAGVISGS